MFIKIGILFTFKLEVGVSTLVYTNFLADILLNVCISYVGNAIRSGMSQIQVVPGGLFILGALMLTKESSV